MNKLTTAQKQAIAERILKLDPKGEIVSLTPKANYAGGTIAYNKESGLTLNENISRLTDEEYVRAYLIVRLIKELRYPPDSIELEKGYTIGRPTGKSAQVDIRVLDKREAKKKVKTFMLIEAKRPDDYESYTSLMEDQLFSPGNQEHAAGVRYIAWYSLDMQGGEFRDQCIIVDFRKFTDYKEWALAGEPGHNLDLPAEYGTVRKQKYVKSGDTDLRTDLTRQELTKLQKDFHNVLWGGAKMGDTDVFNNLLKMFIAKIFDEQTTEEGRAYRFQIELKDGSPETATEILDKVNRTYKDALRHYFRYPEEVIQLSAINKEKFKPEKVAYVMERLEGISLTENKFEDDVLGAFFEAIVRTGFKQEKGQFFTHSNIVRFLLYALHLDEWAISAINGTSPRLLYIIDPACGSGTFLIEAMKLITRSVLHTNAAKLKRSPLVRDYVQEWFQPSSPNKNIHNRWAREFVYGVEDNGDLAMATKVNMILHGDGNSNIEKEDGLADFEDFHRDRTRVKREDPNYPYKQPRNEQFDCVISNPPFSLKEDERTLSKYKTRFAYADKKNSENLFIERWYQLLKEGGRLGVVLPDSVFDTNENLYIRMFLYRFFSIRAVVSLPVVSFQPYTPTKTSLLFAVKKTRQDVDLWDRAWRMAANDYGKLRRSDVIQFVLTNDRIRSALIGLANKAEVDWYPAANLLPSIALPTEVRTQIALALAESPSLKKRCAATFAELDSILETDPLKRLEHEESEESIEVILRLLRDKAPREASMMRLSELIDAAYDEIVEAADLNYTEDPKGQNYCNAWWCFAEVAAQEAFRHDIFFAEATQVGYKRTSKHPEGIRQPNDLFAEDEDGHVIIDTEKQKTILDALRAANVFAD
jgi:type I restriction enzyme M protein